MPFKITKFDEWLRKKGMTNKEVGAYLGVSEEMGRLLRAGKRSPGPDVLERIVDLTNGHITGKDFGK